jgi:large subunit ribosomal protein L5
MSASAPARSLVRFGRPPRAPKRVTHDRKTLLPRPPTNLVIREFAPCRIEDHYYDTLRDNLMYMTYKHELGPRPPPRQVRTRYDPADPYSKYRYNPPVGGVRLAKKLLPPSNWDNVIQLEKVQIHTMVKEAVADKSNLLGAIMAFKALSGETLHGGGHHAVEGVQIVHARKMVGGWLRKGLPVGIKVDMKGRSMYDFITTLVEFVLPRLREFNGVLMPLPSARYDTPSAISGVVSFGLPAHAMALFPQIEVNVDQYPKMYGMHVHFVTNATGVGAQEQARALVSGLQIPFIRR